MFLFSAQCLSIIIAFALPSVSASVYFYSKSSDTDAIQADTDLKQIQRDGKIIENIQLSVVNSTITGNTDYKIPKDKSIVVPTPSEKQHQSNESEAVFSYKRAFTLLWCHFKTSYSNKLIIMWSVWWALGTCGMYQVGRRWELVFFVYYILLGIFITFILCGIKDAQISSIIDVHRECVQFIFAHRVGKMKFDCGLIAKIKKENDAHNF